MDWNGCCYCHSKIVGFYMFKHDKAASYLRTEKILSDARNLTAGKIVLLISRQHLSSSFCLYFKSNFYIIWIRKRILLLYLVMLTLNILLFCRFWRWWTWWLNKQIFQNTIYTCMPRYLGKHSSIIL